MTYDKTWTFQLNNIPTDQSTLQSQCRSWFLQLKSFLVSAGWTVVSSSNGVSYSNNADLIGNTPSNIIWGSNVEARSWFLMRSPVGIIPGIDGSYLGDQSRVWLLFDCEGSTSSEYNKWSVYFHRESPLIGTPSSSSIPTSNNQIVLANNIIFTRSVLTNCKFHFANTSNGNFYALLTFDGTLICHTVFILYPISDTGSWQNNHYPYAIAAQLSVGDTTDHPRLSRSGSYYAIFWNDLQTKTWHPDGSVSISINYCLTQIAQQMTDAYPYGTGGWWLPLLGNWNAAGGDTELNQWLFNVYVTSVNNNQQVLIGKLSDIKFSGNDAAPNTSVDATFGLPTYCSLRNFWFPVNTRILA